jgi:hypothetical protein
MEYYVLWLGVIPKNYRDTENVTMMSRTKLLHMR